MQYKACTIIAPNMKCAINRFPITRFPPDIPELFIDTLTAIKFPDISRFSRPLATRRICSKRNWWIWIVTGHTHTEKPFQQHMQCTDLAVGVSQEVVDDGDEVNWRVLTFNTDNCIQLGSKLTHLLLTAPHITLSIKHIQWAPSTGLQQADSSPPHITLTIKHTQWAPSIGLQQADSSPPCCSSHNPDHQTYTMTTIDRPAASWLISSLLLLT